MNYEYNIRPALVMSRIERTPHENYYDSFT